MLELVAAKGEEVGLAGITEMLTWDKSTVFRLLTTPWALTENVRKARSIGYAVDDEELTPEVRCIAVPAMIPGSRRFYAIGISGPSLRVVAARVPMLAEQVRNAAEEFTRLFGGKAAE